MHALPLKSLQDFVMFLKEACSRNIYY